MRCALSVLLVVIAVIFEFVECGEYDVFIPNGCTEAGLSNGDHYVKIRSSKLNNAQTPKVPMQVQSQLVQESNLVDMSGQVVQSGSGYDDNDNDDDNSNSNLLLVYITQITCSDGDMYMDPIDYGQIFAPESPEDYTIEEIPADINNKGQQKGQQGDQKPIPDKPEIGNIGTNPLDSSETGKKVKWTTQYIVWLILIIMVAVFGLGLFLLVYWWCCHARNYRLIDTRIYPQTNTNLPINAQIQSSYHYARLQNNPIDITQYGATQSHPNPNTIDNTEEVVERQVIIDDHAVSLP